MSKLVKPGRLYAPMDNHIVRAVKRINGCDGCLYKDMIPCPNSIIKGSKKEPIDCIVSGIIFVKP